MGDVQAPAEPLADDLDSADYMASETIAEPIAEPIDVQPPAASNLGFCRYGIKSKHDGAEVDISAKNPDQAWRKFATQRSGVLKPARKDWTIARKG
jgi:hypothetical protein